MAGEFGLGRRRRGRKIASVTMEPTTTTPNRHYMFIRLYDKDGEHIWDFMVPRELYQDREEFWNNLVGKYFHWPSKRITSSQYER